ncbi:biotin transporter BioY [Vagococcus xieshaowenii]|uniref:Biotin transporter n=1 Tax=Vagococcus xieshaowenii TaxID=2562451 RepID=A0AAJ5EDG9_9ENTE|nr:biotin transporter BioY [Vagococcus xieshaowenii]QCA28034.1 biotin transporter BioY [Vagococcus xieshaowenii]TFZ39986.1 biotin transporter BioY [Vagococcus xieshaowenii]
MKVKDMTVIAMMIAIIIMLGLIPPVPLGFIPVPIVFQNIGIMLAGIILGAKRGGFAVVLFLILVAIGMPLLSGGSGGISVFVGPTSGYLMGWLVSTFIIGYAKHLFIETKNPIFRCLIIWLPGVLFVDILGSIGLMIVTNMNVTTALISNLAFLPGDTLKVIFVVTIASRLLKLPLFSR